MPSGDPLDALPLRQLLVFLARARRRSLTELARLLHVSRKTVAFDLRAALATLAGAVPHRPPAEAKARGRAYSCPHHRHTCTGNCRYLRTWLKDFDRSQPPETRP